MRGREDKRKIEIEALPHDKKPTEVPASVGFIHLVYGHPPAGYSPFCRAYSLPLSGGWGGYILFALIILMSS